MSMNKTPVLASMEEACRAVQIELKKEPRPGAWSLADAVDGERVGKGAGRIYVFPDGKGGIAWNWRLGGAQAIWFIDADKKLSDSEMKKLRRQADLVMKEAEEQRQRRHTEVACFAESLLADAVSAVSVGHGYLKLKRVRPVAGLWVMDAVEIQARFNAFFRDEPRTLWDSRAGRPMADPVLMVPLYIGKNFSSVSSIEFISECGGKYTLPEARAAGACWVPEALRKGAPLPERIGVAEGLATALSVSQVKGFPVAAARSCGNLKAAAQALKLQFFGVRLIVLGDKGNGEEKAREVAQYARTAVAVPSFSDQQRARFRQITGSNSAPTDFNDYYIATGKL